MERWIRRVVGTAVVVAAVGLPTAALAVAGTLDPAFSDDGKVTTPKLPFTAEAAEAVVVQDDGRIILVGGSVNDDTGDIRAVALRYVDDGTPDPDFGDGAGRAVLPFSPAYVYDAALLSDGRIVLAGEVFVGGDWRFAVMLLDADGNVDSTFGDAGLAVIDFGPEFSLAYAVAVDASDRIVVAGQVETTRGWAFATARLDSTGTPDPGFSMDGQRTVSFPGGAIARDVAVQQDGKVVVVGSTSATNRFATVRLLDDGSFDTAFSDDARQTTGVGGGTANAVALQSDNRIVVAGGEGIDFLVVRYRPNGTLYPTFGRKGRVTTDFGGNALGLADIATDVVVAGRKIIAVGEADVDYDFAIARYREDGSLYRSFSGNGKLRTNFKHDYGLGAAPWTEQADS